MIIEEEELFFVEYLSDPNKKIMYAPLRSYMALISSCNAEKLLKDSVSDVRRKVLSKLKSRPVINTKQILADLTHTTQELAIPITDNCNLRCLYCHASAGEAHKTESMSCQAIDAVVKSYFDNLNPNASKAIITFTGGGEPTYRFRELKHAIEKCKQLALPRGITCEFKMATNGCYGPAVQQFIVENFSEVSLSFDGPAHIQNRHRPFTDGSPSFDYVFASARSFYSKGFPFALRVTVSDYSLDSLTETIDFFAENFGGVPVAFEPLTVVGRALKNPDLGPPDLRRFAEKLIECIEYGSRRNVKISNSASSEYDILRPVFCSAVGVPNWTVQLNGNIVCCARDGAPAEFTFGRIDFASSQVEIDQVKIEKIRKMNVLNYEECADCFAKYHCAGDCPDRRLSSKSDCVSIRMIGRHILNSKITARPDSRLT